MKTTHLVMGAVLVAVVVAAGVSYIAADHNPQGEFSLPAGEVSVGLLFSRIFLPYFIAALLCALFIAFLVKGVVDENAKQPER